MTYTHIMTLHRFRRIARRAIKQLPDALRPYADECMISTRRRPSKKLRRELGLADNEVLFGLYQGCMAGRQEHAQMPPRIVLFYEALIDACETEKELERQIHRTVLHEIGHHFGMDEDQLAELGYG